MENVTSRVEHSPHCRSKRSFSLHSVLCDVVTDLPRVSLRYRRTGKSVHDLRVQFEVFDEQKESSSAALVGVDVSSHLDVFNAILLRVANTPQEIPFLSILQHLLRIDPKARASDIVWDTVETLVSQATGLESQEDAALFLQSLSLTQSKLCSNSTVGSRKSSLSSTVLVTPPPAPPPPVLVPAPPLPPPMGPSASPESANSNLLPQQETPTPRTKMKTLNWNKISDNKVVGKQNIWSIVAKNHQGSPKADMEWNEMEGLFSLQTPATPTSTVSLKPSRDTPDATRRKQQSGIALLDGKRSLNVNIFLKQFKTSNEEIIELIKNGAVRAEKLEGLLKILPEAEELEMLRHFNGDKTNLGNAENFLLQLIKVPNYKLRIESMLLKEEFAANMSYLSSSINAMIVAGKDLMRNEALREVLYILVVVGNFLNYGGYAGNAAGFKVSSLQKLTEIRANKSGMHLLHFVAQQAGKRMKEFTFPEDMGILEEATKTTSEQLQNEIKALDSRINEIRQQIDLASTENEIKEQMIAVQEVNTLQKVFEELETVRKSLAEFFCEDPNAFKLEECFKVFHSFCLKYRMAVIENEKRRQREIQMASRQKQSEEQLIAKRRPITPGSKGPECNIVEIRTRFGVKNDPQSWNTLMTSEVDDIIVSIIGYPANSREDTDSPRVTPTGSMRRKKVRPLPKEDSSLMDFLLSSEGDDTRERKSWRTRGSGFDGKEIIRRLSQNSMLENSLPVYIECPTDSSDASIEQLPDKQTFKTSGVVPDLEAVKMSPLSARSISHDRSPANKQTPPFAPITVKTSEPQLTGQAEIDLLSIQMQEESSELSKRCSRLKEEIKEEEDSLDKISSIRRSQKYWKNVENDNGRKPKSPPETVTEKQIIQSTTQRTQSVPVETVSSSDKELGSKKYQDKLKYRDFENETLGYKTAEDLKKVSHSSILMSSLEAYAPLDTILETGVYHGEVTVVPKKLAHESLPNRNTTEDGRVGILKTHIKDEVNKSVSINERWLSKRELFSELGANESSLVKLRTEHELNDEGFKETESLVNRSLSQRTTSGNDSDFVETSKSKTAPKLLQGCSSPSTGSRKSGIPQRIDSFRRPETQPTIKAGGNNSKTSTTSLAKLRPETRLSVTTKLGRDRSKTSTMATFQSKPKPESWVKHLVPNVGRGKASRSTTSSWSESRPETLPSVIMRLEKDESNISISTTSTCSKKSPKTQPLGAMEVGRNKPKVAATSTSSESRPSSKPPVGMMARTGRLKISPSSRAKPNPERHPAGKMKVGRDEQNSLGTSSRSEIIPVQKKNLMLKSDGHILHTHIKSVTPSHLTHSQQKQVRASKSPDQLKERLRSLRNSKELQSRYK